MNPKNVLRAARLSIVALLMAAATATMLAPAPAQAGNLNRLAAFYGYHDYFRFSATSAFDSEKRGGERIFRKRIFVPSGVNTVFITIGASVYDPDGVGLWVDCLINNNFCRKPKPFGGDRTPAGWLEVLHQDSSGSPQFWQSFYYTWCHSIKSGARSFEIRMATGKPRSTTDSFEVFIRNIHVYVDVANLPRGFNCKKQELPIQTFR